VTGAGAVAGSCGGRAAGCGVALWEKNK